jgi:uncharacterized membrane protein YhaH (DUF805 family)
MYRLEFAVWLVPTSLLTNLVYVRAKTRLPFLGAVVADVAMTALSWSLTVAVPLWLLAWGLAYQVMLDRIVHDPGAPASWILALLIAVLISTAFQSAVLHCFKHRATKAGFWLLFLVNLFCMVLASYRTCIYVLAHPPDA